MGRGSIRYVLGSHFREFGSEKSRELLRFHTFCKIFLGRIFIHSYSHRLHRYGMTQSIFKTELSVTHAQGGECELRGVVLYMELWVVFHLKPVSILSPHTLVICFNSNYVSIKIFFKDGTFCFLSFQGSQLLTEAFPLFCTIPLG